MRFWRIAKSHLRTPRAESSTTRTVAAELPVRRRRDGEVSGQRPRRQARQLGLQVVDLRRGERDRDGLVESLEERVDDLDLVRALAQDGQRVDEALGAVVALRAGDEVVAGLQAVALVVD